MFSKHSVSNTHLDRPTLLIERILQQVQLQPEATAYTLLDPVQNNVETLSYLALHKKACFLAEILNQKQLYQERIILLYPSHLAFIVSFVACLYSGSIGIPIFAYPESLAVKHISLVKHLIEDAGVKVILTLTTILTSLKKDLGPLLEDIEIITPELSAFAELSDMAEGLPAFSSRDPDPSTITHLQYTSGSTSVQRAVICRHENLAHSLFQTAKAWGYRSDSVTVSWTPHGHVYGLTAGLLVPLYTGTAAILMSPQDFLMDPIAWLQTISKYQATHSGCPNFGYEHCLLALEDLNATELTTLQDLKLNTWQVASNGGERVNSATLLKFYEQFQSYGFRLESFHPAYGMSECTGLIATSKMNTKPRFIFLEKKALAANRLLEVDNKLPEENFCQVAQTFVSCGTPLPGFQVEIVDPNAGTILSPNTLGEITLRGPMCSYGYWNQKESQDQKLRTGDLGFIKEGEIFLVGRLKEIIKIYGKNYYPTDIETLIKQAETSRSKLEVLAFSSYIENAEELFILQEHKDDLSAEEFRHRASGIRRLLAEQLGIDSYAIIFIGVGSLPKTGSGKIQRAKAVEQYFEHQLKVVFESVKTRERV